MKLIFKTNLDEPRGDVLDLGSRDTSLFPIPRKGERIAFPFSRNGKPCTYELEVCSVSYNYPEGRVSVELHIPSYYMGMSIDEWSRWFKNHRFG